MMGCFQPIQIKVPRNHYHKMCIPLSAFVRQWRMQAMLPQCEKLARDIYNYFRSSSKRQSEFKEFQSFADIHKMLRPSQTRWLSLSAVVDRIIEQWNVLTLYFNSNGWKTTHVAAKYLFSKWNSNDHSDPRKNEGALLWTIDDLHDTRHHHI